MDKVNMEAEPTETGDSPKATVSSEEPKIDRSKSVQEQLSHGKGKSKRTRSVSISEPQPTRVPAKFSKNSRRSRAGVGRGLPKKGEYGAIAGHIATYYLKNNLLLLWFTVMDTWKAHPLPDVLIFC